jgi:hypothetical protein
VRCRWSSTREPDVGPGERLRPPVVLDVHLSDLALAGLAGPVARVERVGPVLADSDLFARCSVTLKPVIDLNERVDLNCYEHPPTVSTRCRAR